MTVRFFFLTFFFVLIFGFIGLNLYRLQVLKGDYYIERAEARSEFQAQLELRRGYISLTNREQNKVSVALNRDYPVIFASPKEIKESVLTAQKLASFVGWEEEKLKRALTDPTSLFKLLLDKAAPEAIEAVRELNLRGIYLDKKQYRSYSFDNLASHVIGFVGFNAEAVEPIGLYGVEKLHNRQLAEGDEINLTIDINLQSQAEEVLEKLISRFHASGGTIIIQEPKSGKILTLANAPDFNPNAYNEFPIKNFLNPAVQSIYEPGSVFKPITMAVGLDLQVFTPTSTYFDRGSIVLNGKKIENWDKKAYGETSITKVLERSINTGAVWAGEQIGRQRFYEYLKAFGFGARTNIDLPDETTGSLKNLEKKDSQAIDFATASFGQGTAVTPLQLVTAYSAIANGGLLMRPYINEDMEPYVVRRVISKKAASEVTEMMEKAVISGGLAGIPQYRVAGKTGTAQVPDFQKGGYSEELIHTYAGFAPASDPRFVILLKLDKPQSSLAALTVVPAFRELAEYVLNYYHIPPDKLIVRNQ